MKTVNPVLTAYIKQIDDKLTEVLNAAGPVSESEFAKLLCKVVTTADTSMVPEADRKEMLDVLSGYVNEKLSLSPVATVTIGGEKYAISPEIVVPVDRLELLKKVMPWSEETMDRFLENAGDGAAEWVERMLDHTTGKFRPFLVRQIYNYLVGKAFLGHTTTYENIANEFGLPNKGNQLGSTLSPLLSSIYKFCETHHQPMLTVIVVRKSGEHKDLPGNGFWALYNKHPALAVETIEDRRRYTRSLQQQVFEYWSALGK
jgi:alkylated DNA nucleotide flippase Atl1